MRQRSFSVHDSKAKAYLPPFFCPEVGQASRLFCDLVNQEGHQFNAHPEDYCLFEIGLFDDNTALLEPFGPEIVITGMQAAASGTAVKSDPSRPFLVEESQ